MWMTCGEGDKRRLLTRDGRISVRMVSSSPGWDAMMDVNMVDIVLG